MNLYTSLDEIKTYLGISGSSSDGVLALIHKSATRQVNEILGVNDLSLHLETNEVHDGYNASIVDLHEMHVQSIGQILCDGVEYTQTEEYDIDNYRLHLESYLQCGKRDAKITYAAGWNASGMATLTVSDVDNIGATAQITIGDLSAGNTVLERGTDWTGAATEEAEATAIAAAITELVDGVRAFACGTIVYIIEDSAVQVEGRTVETDDSTRLTLSSATLTGVDFPEAIREAIFIYCSNGMTKRKNPRVSSYTIGTKTVQFANQNDFKQFHSLLKPYMRAQVHVL